MVRSPYILYVKCKAITLSLSIYVYTYIYIYHMLPIPLVDLSFGCFLVTCNMLHKACV